MSVVVNGSRTGLNMRDAIKEAMSLGCKVYIARRTGEYVIEPPEGKGKKVRVNARRKDAPKALTTLLGHLNRSDTTPLSMEDLEPDEDEEAAAEFEEQDLCEVQEVPELPQPVTEEVPEATLALALEVPAVQVKPALADQLRQFREMRQALLDDANKRLGELQADRDELAVMLKSIDDEKSSIVDELEQLGVATATARSESYANAQIKALANNESNLPVNCLVHDFLEKNRGVWFAGPEIMSRIGHSGRQASVLMNALIAEGKVERRGNKRSTLYRMLPLKGNEHE